MKVCVSSSDYLQAFINSLGDELIVIDGNYRIIVANDGVLVRHGKRQREVIGQHCHYSLCELVNCNYYVVVWYNGFKIGNEKDNPRH